MRLSTLPVIAALAAGPAVATAGQGEMTRPVAPETGQALPAAELLGRPVEDAAGTRIGSVADVLLAPGGYPLRLVVALKPGRRAVELETARVEMLPDHSLRAVGLMPQELAALPAWQPDQGEVALSSARKR
jgi:hypothetical protein